MARFALELRKLRREAGSPTYRTMAGRVPYGAATLSEAAAGERLPSLPVALAYARTCGGEEAHWEERWREARREEDARQAREAGKAEEEFGARSPYPGLARFEPADHERFFGREALVAEVVERAHARRLVVLAGPSGCGKSSLLRAGLIPALRGESDGARRPAAVRILTPGANPACTHARALVPAEGEGPTWVLVDQFEEAFTLCREAGRRAAFLDALAKAANAADGTDEAGGGGRLRVVLAVRADFFGRLTEHRDLALATREATVLVAPMSPAELRQAVVGPAQAEGLIVERALTARILEEVDGRPGGLPLMSHALRETWRRRRGRSLTLEGYEAAGGIRGAVARTAEELWTALPPAQAERARLVLLRLIAPGDGAQDTRRPAPRAELEDGRAAEVAPVLERLARARLITLDGESAELAHEALITAWPRLRDWVETGRERLRLHRGLTEAAAAWEALDRDPGALYRGTRLAAAEEAFPGDTDGAPDELTAGERAFLDAGLAAREAERAAAARATRRLRALTAALACLLAAAVVAAGSALWQRQSAVEAQREAESRQLAAQSAAFLESDPDLASLLAVAAYRTHPTSEATAAVHAASALPLRHRLPGHAGGVRAVAFGPGGDLISVDGAGRTRSWNMDNGGARSPAGAAAPSGVVGPALLSPDGALLAAEEGLGNLRIREAASGRLLATLEEVEDFATPLAFTADGAVLATHGPGSVQLWDTSTGRLRRTVTPPSAGLGTLALSADGDTVFTDEVGGPALLDTVTGGVRFRVGERSGLTVAAAFSPDGGSLITVREDGVIRRWDGEDGTELPALGRVDGPLAMPDADGRDGEAFGPGAAGLLPLLAFSPDSRALAVSAPDGTVRVLDAESGDLRATLTGHAGEVTALAFGPDGSLLATGGDDGTVRVWDVGSGPRASLTGAAGIADAVAFTPDGEAVATANASGQVRLWDAASGAPLGTFPDGGPDGGAAPGPGGVGPDTGGVPPEGVGPEAAPADRLDLSPDGRRLAVLGTDGTLRLWDTATRRQVDARPLEDAWGPVAFGPDGTTLASVHGGGGLLRVQDAATGRPLAAHEDEHEDGGVIDTAFSADGTALATLYEDGSVRVRKVDGGEQVAALEDAPGGGGGSSLPGVVFAPDGRTLGVVRPDGTVLLWDTDTGKVRTPLAGETDDTRSLAFGPDGTVLATGSGDGTVRLWDTVTGRPRAELPGGSGPVLALAFSPDGSSLATAPRDGSVLLWEAALPSPAEAVRRLCDALGRDLTAQERAAHVPPDAAGSACPS
ncbi:hypothetical protein RM780_21695 [Streptomyces sp. DSM 44917]|uniref:Novel STAND NTPase 1 domain-containing protein n=1 Tax=Streptomyces boetiae TaxID=3075541 RepID=A0ABU2LDA5_9ACTN|nr:hypothetical protein [Streptomyces sp. DSM 44917]MDT0309550.1 hypothetical protein [Streptomyces sp. DSM 44917]